jgi:hypothetical protein
MRHSLVLRLVGLWIISGLIIGCISSHPIMPTMDLPSEPQKPAIKSSVIVQNNTPWVGYSIQDSLKLYEYLLRKDSYEEKLRFRIEILNK